MNRTAFLATTFSFAGLCAVLCLATSGCDSHDVAAQNGSTMTGTADKAAATPARLVDRSNDRWKRIAKKEWIEAYDFLTPEQKQGMSVSQYVQGKTNHEYANPRVGEVIKLEKDQGYVRVSALWTPHHPQLAKVKLEPGQTLTEDIDMIETWRFVGGDWYYVRAQNEEDFFQHHANLLKKSADAKADDAKPDDAAPPAENKSIEAKPADTSPAQPK
jgi:hypothetical protein